VTSVPVKHDIRGLRVPFLNLHPPSSTCTLAGEPYSPLPTHLRRRDTYCCVQSNDAPGANRRHSHLHGCPVGAYAAGYVLETGRCHRATACGPSGGRPCQGDTPRRHTMPSTSSAWQPRGQPAATRQSKQGGTVMHGAGKMVPVCHLWPWYWCQHWTTGPQSQRTLIAARSNDGLPHPRFEDDMGRFMAAEAAEPSARRPKVETETTLYISLNRT
jgi:hypothetical protein